MYNKNTKGIKRKSSLRMTAASSFGVGGTKSGIPYSFSAWSPSAHAASFFSMSPILVVQRWQKKCEPESDMTLTSSAFGVRAVAVERRRAGRDQHASLPNALPSADQPHTMLL